MDMYDIVEESTIEKPDVYEINNPSEALVFIFLILNYSKKLVEDNIEPDEYLTYAKQLEDAAVNILIDLLIDKTFTAVVEENYVDRIYRDSYYTYYSKKHLNYSRYCKRVLIFDGKLPDSFLNISSDELQNTFKGCFVIRPLVTGKIGRSLLDPVYFKKGSQDFYIRKTRYEITTFGKRLSIDAFPFSMQDSETTTCAEVIILNILDYYSQRYPEYRVILLNDIIHISQKLRYQRLFPSIGLQYELISKVFAETGFSPVIFSDKTDSFSELQHIMYYYIESGIPVVIGLKIKQEKHVIIGIGHGKSVKKNLGTIKYPISVSSDLTLFLVNTADIVDSYCIIDDNQAPYKIVPCIEYKKEKDSYFKIEDGMLEYLIVPLYKRMLLTAVHAYSIIRDALSDKKHGFNRYFSKYLIEDKLTAEKYFSENVGTKPFPLCIRLFMASSKNFRRARHLYYLDKDSELFRVYTQMPLSRFIWVCELYTINSYPDYAIGELIIDATSSSHEKFNSLLMINYPGYYYVRDSIIHKEYPTDVMNFCHNINWIPFKPYEGNLSQ